MPDYSIKGFFVSAPDEGTANELVDSLAEKGERLLVIRGDDGSQQIINIDNINVKIYTRYRTTISYAGEIRAGSGHKILQTAIDSVNVSMTEAAKLSAAVKKANRESKHNLTKKDIDAFESAIPEIAKALYADVMKRVDAVTLAYKLEIITELIQLDIKPDSWVPILVWFRDKVLSDEESKPIEDRRTFFQLRKAFVTAATRMVKDGVRHGNTMKLVKKDGKSDIDWLKYAENKT